MKQTLLSIMFVSITISAPAYAQDTSWTFVENDLAQEAPASSAPAAQSLLKFRADMAAATKRCDQKWLRQAYAPDFQLIEGSGWRLSQKDAVAACKNPAFSNGWDRADAKGLQIRMIGADAAVVTGATQMPQARGGVWVRWIAGYTREAHGRWVAKFAQEHRVPAKPPAPPKPPSAPRGYHLAATDAPPMPIADTWATYWTAAYQKPASSQQATTEQPAKFRSLFLEAVRNNNAPLLQNLYAPDYTITHGSGYVERRETRVLSLLRPNARVPELVDGAFYKSLPFGAQGYILFQALPFAFQGGVSGYISAVTVLEAHADSPADYRIRAMMINSFDWEAPVQRLPSGCEPPPFGSPVAEEIYPNCSATGSVEHQ